MSLLKFAAILFLVYMTTPMILYIILEKVFNIVIPPPYYKIFGILLGFLLSCIFLIYLILLTSTIQFY